MRHRPEEIKQRGRYDDFGVNPRRCCGKKLEQFSPDLLCRRTFVFMGTYMYLALSVMDRMIALSPSVAPAASVGAVLAWGETVVDTISRGPKLDDLAAFDPKPSVGTGCVSREAIALSYTGVSEPVAPGSHTRSHSNILKRAKFDRELVCI